MLNSLTYLLPATYSIPVQSFAELKILKKNRTANKLEIERISYKTEIAAKSCLKGVALVSLTIFSESAIFFGLAGVICNVFKFRDIVAAGNLGFYIASIACVIIGIATISFPAIFLGLACGYVSHLCGSIFHECIDNKVNNNIKHIRNYLYT